MMAWLLAVALGLNIATFVFTAAYKDITHRAEVAAVRVEAEAQCEDRLSDGRRYLHEQVDKAFAPKKKKPIVQKPWWDWGLLG